MLHIIPTPGFVNEWMWIFAAEGLVEGVAQPEDDEKITPRVFYIETSRRDDPERPVAGRQVDCGIFVLHALRETSMIEEKRFQRRTHRGHRGITNDSFTFFHLRNQQ